MANTAVFPSDPAARAALLRTKLVARIENGELQMPILPDVAVHILSNPLTEESDINKLSALIHRDQALAAHVLRVSNSAFYSPRGIRITSLQQAIMRMGTVQLREIVTAVAFKSRIFDVPEYENMMKQLWRHAAGSAFCAREIARLLALDREWAFLGGLLHDIGKPVVLLATVDILRAARAKVPDDDIQKILADYHVGVGELIAEELQLAEPVTEAIRLHARSAEAALFPVETRAIDLADRLAAWVIGAEAEPGPALRESPLLKELNFTSEQAEELFGIREKALQFVDGF